MDQVQPQEEILTLLGEMGFLKERAEFAYKNSQVKTLEGVIAFLETMQDSESNILQGTNNPLPPEKATTESQAEEKKEEKYPIIFL